MDMNMRIGMRIRELRNEKNLSQEELALISNVDRTYIASVENGRRNISINTLGKILQGLELSFSDFFAIFTE